VCYSQWKREKWFNKVATVISFSYISDISSSCLHVLPLLVNLYQMSLYRYTLCPRKKTCDCCILYNNFNSKCPITIIFGIVSSQSMRRRRHTLNFCLSTRQRSRTSRPRHHPAAAAGETPDFIGPDLWPPNSLDLNPSTTRSGESCSRMHIHIV